MPYLPGMTFTDSVGNYLQDAVSNPIQEAAEVATGLIDSVNALYNSIIGSGHGSFWEGVARQILAIYYGDPAWLDLGYQDAYVADMASNVNFLLTYLQPQGQEPASIREQLTAAIQAVRTDVATPHLATVQDVLDTLAAGVEATLPETPPAGYGGATPDEVWGHILNGVAGGAVTADEGLSVARNLGNFYYQYLGLPTKSAPFFFVDALAAAGGTWPQGFEGVTFDLTDILANDTVLSWLQRTDTSDRVWQVDPTTGLVYSETNLGDEYHSRITCSLTDAELQAIRAGYGAGTATVTGVPPTFPGIANVTLGTPVALDFSVTVPGPLDGVLVEMTTPPSGLSTIVIGTYPYHYRIGEITFISDDGQAEPFQYLGFENGVYLPRQLVQAASARLRVLGAAEGTATPFTINP